MSEICATNNDASHIKLKESLDSGEPTVKYLWRSNQIEFEPKEINLKANPKEHILKLYPGTNEFIALNILKENGFNVIKAEFAYRDNNKSYIVYNYTNLETVENTKKLTKQEKERIKSKLYFLKKELNESLKEHTDIKIRDIGIHNTFIDFENKKLYITDPYIYTKEFRFKWKI